MRHPTEITFVMFALALLAKPANPVVRWFFADGNKCSGLPPLRAKTALMKVGKLCIASFHNVKEFISLEQIRRRRMFQRSKHVARVTVTVPEESERNPSFLMSYLNFVVSLCWQIW